MTACLPPIGATEFTVTLPCDIRPRSVGAGYDWQEGSPWSSFVLTLDLDWTRDAPRICRAWLESYDRRSAAWVPVPHDHIRLAYGDTLADPDVFNSDDSMLICDVRFRPLAEAHP